MRSGRAVRVSGPDVTGPRSQGRARHVAPAIPLAAGAIFTALFLGLLLVLLLRPAGDSSGWSVADSPFVLAATLFLLEGIVGATAVGAWLSFKDAGSRGTWLVLGVVGVALAVVCLWWFADLGRGLVLAAPCVYLATYAGVRVWKCGRAHAGAG
jgi:FtsH-binding integral membrane protein